jgi:hypothetical protein
MQGNVNFGWCHLATWREGGLPKASGGDIVVSHDQRHDAYSIPAGEEAAFRNWVAATWESDDEPWGIDEGAQAYLDRRGITVRATQ